MNKKVMSLVAIIALIAILTVCLVACNADTYKKKLDKADYAVSSLDQNDLSKLGIEDSEVKWAVYGIKGLNYVNVIKFNKIADAKEFYENYKVSSALITIERSSSYVFIGTPDGIDVVK